MGNRRYPQSHLSKEGGGTEFAPAFKWIQENVMDSFAVILMTDGYHADEEISIPFSVEKPLS